MLLRYNKGLKYLIILLFSIELVVPAFIQRPDNDTNVNSSHQKSLIELTRGFDGLANFFFEENNTEEREGKDYDTTFFYFIEVFSDLEKFKPVDITWSNPKERAHSQPNLYTLHRVLLI